MRRAITGFSALCAVWLCGEVQASAATFDVIYRFTGKDGTGPNALVFAGGRLYGATTGGGPNGLGALFTILLPGESNPKYVDIHDFAPSEGGGATSLVGDSNGNLYGTLANGGSQGFGALFELDSQLGLTILHSFSGGADGAFPVSLTRAANGALYGTTEFGAQFPKLCNGQYCGTAFTVAQDGAYKVLFEFLSGAPNNPGGAIIRSGNLLYGTVGSPGGNISGGPYSLSTDGSTFNSLYSNCPYGGGSVAQDLKGNIWATSVVGPQSGSGYGAIYSINSDGTCTIVHTFQGSDGAYPEGLIVGDDGYLYGVTIGSLSFGGGSGPGGYGTVFKFAPSTGNFLTLHSFQPIEGINPGGPLVQDAAGNLYGTALNGGTNKSGTVFRIKP